MRKELPDSAGLSHLADVAFPSKKGCQHPKTITLHQINLEAEDGGR